MDGSARHVRGTGPLAYSEDVDALRDGTVEGLCDALALATKRYLSLKAAAASAAQDPRKTAREKTDLAKRMVAAELAYNRAEREHRAILKKAFREAGVNVIHEVDRG